MKNGKFWFGLIIGGITAFTITAVTIYAFRGAIAQLNLGGTPNLPPVELRKTSEISKQAMDHARWLVAVDDRKDFDFVERGFIATRQDPLIRNDKAGIPDDTGNRGSC